MSENRSEFKLKNGPDDGISAVRFGPSSSQFLLASSWDSHVRLYDVVSNSLRLKYSHGGRPVLSCAFQDPIHVWSGGKFVSFHLMQKCTINNQIRLHTMFWLIENEIINYRIGRRTKDF